MKTIQAALAALLALFALACGAPPEDLFPDAPDGGEDQTANVDEDGSEYLGPFIHYASDEGNEADQEIGQSALALTRIGSHGIESGNGQTCIVPWDGNCNVTSSKLRRIGFSASTCNTWWQTRVVEVYNEFNWNHNDFGWTWGEGNQEGTIRCGGTLPDGSAMPNNVLGATWFNPPHSVIEQSPYGTVRRWGKSTTRINVVGMEALPSWAGKTDAQKQRAARSNIRHELYHAMGRGHNTYPGSLMYSYFDEANYYSDIQLRTEERDSFNSFVP